jgi:hypothetical protein
MYTSAVRLAIGAMTLMLGTAAAAAPTSILFVGNSYTFGRVDPVMSYNAANVRDLTAPVPGSSFENTTGSNVFEPHPWGGVAGIFKQFTVQAGLDYDVALSARNAASLRGHFLNTNPADWDLRGNIAAQTWDKVVLQEQSDEALTQRPGLASNPVRFKTYVDKIAEYAQSGAIASYRERDYYPGATNAIKTANCVAATGASSSVACNTLRGTDPNLNSPFPVNENASADTEVYLYQTWARPNLVDGAFVSITDETTGEVTRTTTPATTFFADLEAMTEELRLSYADAAALSGRVSGIAPVGEAFMAAVLAGIATRDLYAPDALTDGLMDLWFDDGTHASKHGSYLSALTLFGTLTGRNPFSLGADEIAARDLGITSADAVALQRIAAQQLGMSVPEPGTLALTAAALFGLVCARRRRQR